MAEVRVQLVDWEHECCGETRRVGDTVSMSVFYNHGLVEQRHDYGNEFQGQPITGDILAIEWRQVDDVGHLVEDSPSVELTTTDDRPSHDSYVFEFTVATDDPLPGPA
jgi:hypothetical protein